MKRASRTCPACKGRMLIVFADIKGNKVESISQAHHSVWKCESCEKQLPHR